MPFRLTEKYQGWRAKVQFTTSHEMPRLVYQACVATGTRSNTVYYQKAICQALSRDLGIPIEQLYANLPIPLGPSGHLYDPDEGSMARRVDAHHPYQVGSSANCVEEVK